ncbi:MAG: OmpH family outer membrane protein [Planctomycetaceae bacterium]
MLSRCGVCFLALSFGALAGCDRLMPAAKQSPPQTPPVGGVGVVDLDAVARRLGRDALMNDAVQGRLDELNAELTKLQQSLSRLLEDKRETIGDDPTEDQARQLAGMQARIDQQLLEAKRTAEAKLAAYKQAQVDEFREQTKPAIKAVAATRGLSIVVPKNSGLLLSIDPAVELTDDVAARMLDSRPAGARGPETTAEKPRHRRGRHAAEG